MKIILSGFILLTALIVSGNTHAVMLGFNCITNNDMNDCNIGEAQASVEVTDAGNNQVRFTFSNSGSVDVFISDIYFDNGEPGRTLAGIVALEEMMGVDFQVPIPGMGGLPGGNTVGFTSTINQNANNVPGAANGINPGEMLGILFDLVTGQSFANVLAELANGDLRVGIHVQGFEPGSESFVNTPVPIPAAFWLFGSGVLALAGLNRRKIIS